MDLLAYAQIQDDKIQNILKENDIQIPRERGYRLMSEEEPIPPLSEKRIREIAIEVAEQMIATRYCKKGGFYYSEYSAYTDAKLNWYIDNWEHHWDMYNDDYDGPLPEIRWDRFGRKRRRLLKIRIKNKIRKYQQNFDTFNKYVGRSDILYAHARIGGGNWDSYKDEVLGKPWFIEKCDDPWDFTYCDIYCKIKGGEEE